MVQVDLSSLPSAEKPASNKPVANPEFVSAIAESWYRRYLDSGADSRSMAIESLPYRASFTAFRCDRQLYYAMTGTHREPASIADAYRMSLGSLVHSGLEDAIKDAFPGAQFEVPVDLRNVGVPGSAHADIVTYLDDGSVDAVVEVKTVNGFGFKSMATDFKGPAQGPRSGHVLQAALSAMALGARRVIVSYLSMENLSPSTKRYVDSEIGRFAAEWHFSKEEYTALASKEIARINRVARWAQPFDEALIAPTTLHDDEIADGAFVSDPERGMWITTTPTGDITNTGRVWFCDYCDWRDRCVADQVKWTESSVKL